MITYYSQLKKTAQMKYNTALSGGLLTVEASNSLNILVLPLSCLQCILEYVNASDLYSLSKTNTFFWKTYEFDTIRAELTCKYPKFFENGVQINKRLISSLRLIDLIGYNYVKHVVQKDGDFKTNISLEVLIKSCGLKKPKKIEKENITPNMGTKESNKETNQYGLYVDSNGKSKGFIDDYTSSIQQVSNIKEALQKNTKTMSWMRLAFLHESYLKIVESQTDSEVQGLKVSEKLRDMVLQVCPDFSSCFNRFVDLKIFALSLLGHPIAQNDVAIGWINRNIQKRSRYTIYRHSIKRSQDLANIPFIWGVYWFKQAAARSFGLARYCLATCLAFPFDQRAKPDEQVKIDFNIVFRLYWEAANEGIPEAQTNIGMIYYGDFPGNKKNENISQNYKQAERWWRKAAEAGQVDALLNLGLLLRRLNNKAESIFYLKLAANKECARACYLVGKAYETGNGVEKNLFEAHKWMLKASHHTDSEDEANHIMHALQRLRSEEMEEE